jgi:hypothetical protein
MIASLRLKFLRNNMSIWESLASRPNFSGGGGTQIWLPDDVRDMIDWNAAEGVAEILPQY